MTLRADLLEAEANVEAIKRRIAAATCREAGCDMVHVGGRNAGCSDSCQCSIPVYACTRCGDSDYGDNPEADERRKACERGEHYESEVHG